jgi:rhodanese-related sulfurtransferase
MEFLKDLFDASPMLVMLLAGLTLALIVTEVAALFRGYKSVSPAQATDLINREDAIVIDLRGQGDFEKGHIIGARHVLPSQVEPTHKALANAVEKPVVLVCATGMSASTTAGKLVKAGYKRVSVLDGGIGAWQAAGLPLARGKA